MRRLLPALIEGWQPPVSHSHSSGVEHQSSAQGAVLVLDAEGSTELSARLRSQRTLEAESLSTLLTQIFGPVVDMVIAAGGAVAHFTGDGVIAVFLGEPTDAVASAVAAGHDILDHLATVSGVVTPAGPVDLVVRAVVGAGSIETTMWLAPAIEDLTRQNATYVVVGSALAEAQRGELAVHGGALVVGPVAATFLSPGHFVAVGEGFVRVERDDLPARSHDRPALTPSTPNPSARWRYVIPGAYDDRLRPAFSHVSVAFVELRTWPTPETMATIIELTGESGGHASSLLRTAPDQEGLTMILVWGAPVGHDNDARRTLWFVEAAQQKLGVGSFRTGAGYANLFSGFVGSEQQSTYTVVGAPVNLAARLCSLASWGEIRVTEVFDDVVPEQWLVESVDPILYKGFQVPLATRSLRPMSGADTDQRGRSHLATSGDSPLLTGPRTELRARAAGRHPPDADDEPSVVD